MKKETAIPLIMLKQVFDSMVAHNVTAKDMSDMLNKLLDLSYQNENASRKPKEITLLPSKTEKYRNHDLLTTKEAAEFLGIAENTLAVWKCNKRYNLRYVKVGSLTKYRYKDLLEFLENRTYD